MNNLSGDDLVYYKENGRIMSGGFNINSILMKQGTSPLVSLNNDAEAQTGGSLNSVSNLFKSLAVPTGLLYLHEKKKAYKNLDYDQNGGKKLKAKKVKVLNDNDDESSTSSSSGSSSSSDSDSDSDSDSVSSKDLDRIEILNEAVFLKCLDIVSRMEIAKQKVQKRKSRKNNKTEKSVKKKQSRKNKK